MDYIHDLKLVVLIKLVYIHILQVNTNLKIQN
jgi:hypothetical protein